jgi:hypothetical protein
MATVSSTSSNPVTSHARIRIRIGDIRRQIGPDQLDDILPRARAFGATDVERRVKNEIEVIRSHGLGEACSELIAISQALAPAGHRIEVLRAPVSLMLFHLAGLTMLDPREHRLLTDTWPPAGDPDHPPAPWAVLRSPTRHIGISLAMEPEDLISFLRLRGYSLRTERLSWEKVNGSDLCFDQVTAKQYPSTPDHQTVTVFVSTGIFARLAATVTPEEAVVCLRDTQTYHLLAAADTDSIGPLRFPGVKRLLKQRKPSSLEELAAILASTNDTGEPTGDCETLLYLEDLLLELTKSLGISVADSRTLYDVIGQDREAEKYRAWIIGRAMQRGMDRGAAEAFLDRLRNLAKNRTAASRATVLPLAHRCLRAVYLKAHYPEHFRAIVASTRR